MGALAEVDLTASCMAGFEELVVPISVNLMEEAPPGSEGSGAVALRDSVGRLRENIDQVNQAGRQVEGIHHVSFAS